MPQEAVQLGMFMIDDYIFADESGALYQLKQFINELAAKFETPIFGILLTTSRARAQNLSYYQNFLSPNIKLSSALVLPAVGEAKQNKVWAKLFSAGLGELIASISVRKDVVAGMWYYIDNRSRMYGHPLELVYWVLLFTGFNPLFMRRVIYFCGTFLECPSHPSAADIVVRKGKDHRDILLMSLASIRLGVAHSPYKIAKSIEEMLGSHEYGSADSLRKTITAVLRDAVNYCLVSLEGSSTTYTVSPFGELLLDVLLRKDLIQYIMPSKSALFIENIMSISGVK